MAVPTRTVYVGNIPYSSTPESLMEALVDYEPISIKVIEGKGIAFVELPARRAFGIVRDLDGSKLEGRLLAVSIATPRENEPTFTQEQDHDRTRRHETRVGYNAPGRDDRSYGGNPRFGNRDGGNDQGQERPNYAPREDRPFQPRGNRPDDRGPGRPRPYGDRPPSQRGSDRNDGNRPPRSNGYQASFNGDRPPYQRGPDRNDGSRPPRSNGYQARSNGYQDRPRFEGGDDRPRESSVDGRPPRSDARPRPYGERPPYQQNSDAGRGYGRENGNGRPGEHSRFPNSGSPRGQDRPARPDDNRGGGGYRGSDRPSGSGGDRPNRPSGDFRGGNPGYKPKGPYSGGSDRGGAPSAKPKKFFKKR